MSSQPPVPQQAGTGWGRIELMKLPHPRAVLVFQ